MLSKHILTYYNHLLATSLLYVTMIDPIRDISHNLAGQAIGYQGRLITLVLASDPGQEQNHYETLGVKKDATKQEIHRAFRQLAKKYHPDKNKDKSASDEFIKIFKAYETLSDEKKRKEYDDYTNGRASGGWTTAAPNGAYDFDINDFFRQYEDQFLRHAQQHQHTHHNQQNYHAHHHQNMHNHMHHDNLKFHGINLDELFHDIDDDEFSSFGRWFDNSNHNHNHYHQETLDGHFGDGASFFGSHFAQPNIHDTLRHQQQQQQQQHFAHHQHPQASVHHAGYTCQTITKQVNGMVMTQTSCS